MLEPIRLVHLGLRDVGQERHAKWHHRTLEDLSLHGFPVSKCAEIDAVCQPSLATGYRHAHMSMGQSPHHAQNPAQNPAPQPSQIIIIDPWRSQR